MKKILASLILPFFAFAGFSQVLKPVKIDSLVTISLPTGYQQKDTLNQQIFSANALYGYTVTIRQPNAKNNTPLKKESDLSKVLRISLKTSARNRRAVRLCMHVILL